MRTRPPIDLGDSADAFRVALSADGSTLVAIEPSSGDAFAAGAKATIVVRDARTGEERLRFPSPSAVERPRLSRDGSRLVVDRRLDGLPATFEWYTFDTRDGRLIAIVPGKDGWVEVETGRIVADGLDGELIQQVIPAPDGSTVYAVGPEGGRWLRAWVTEPEDYVRSYVVRRLDATTLEILAERTLSDYPTLLVGAAKEAA